MQVLNDRIVFADHAVVLLTAAQHGEYAAEYVQSMASEFEPNSTIRESARRESARVLRSLNNDGSWGIERLPSKN